jgi:hypothetical protein
MYLHLNWVVICHVKIIWKKAGERKNRKISNKNNCVWIAHYLIYITLSSNGYNTKPPVRDMSCSLMVASTQFKFYIKRFNPHLNHMINELRYIQRDTFIKKKSCANLESLAKLSKISSSVFYYVVFLVHL